MAMRVGVLGGTFDPVHMGHLIIAEEAQNKLGLSEVIFIPAGDPWLKAGSNITDGMIRLNMLKMALEGNPSFRIDTQEIDRKGPSFTVDTIVNLSSRLKAGSEIYFIIGLDALADLAKWKHPRHLADICCFATMKRPGYTALDLKALEVDIPGVSERIHILDNIQVDISSSNIRQRLYSGLSIRYLVPAGIKEYIESVNLYRDTER